MDQELDRPELDRERDRTDAREGQVVVPPMPFAGAVPPAVGVALAVGPPDAGGLTGDDEEERGIEIERDDPADHPG